MQTSLPTVELAVKSEKVQIIERIDIQKLTHSHEKSSVSDSLLTGASLVFVQIFPFLQPASLTALNFLALRLKYLNNWAFLILEIFNVLWFSIFFSKFFQLKWKLKNGIIIMPWFILHKLANAEWITVKPLWIRTSKTTRC